MSRSSDHRALAAVADSDAALCTIVRIEGSYSRRCGAQIAVARDGSVAGSLADSCLDAELASQSERARAQGAATTIRYGAGSPIIDFRLPCGSALDILVDPTPDRAAAQRAVAQLDARRPAALALAKTIDAPDVLTERQYIPASRLIVLGSGAEHSALCGLASFAGVAVESRTPPAESAARLVLGAAPHDLSVDAWTAIILLFHDHEWEAALLDWALRGPAFYIGAQGGIAVRDKRRSDLLAAGHDPLSVARLRSPVGLIPRVRDPEVMGVSILAEIFDVYERLHPHR